MTEEQKNWIDNSTFEQLFAHRRFAPAGDPIFRNKEASEYFARRMTEKEIEEGVDRVAISKRIGFL